MEKSNVIRSAGVVGIFTLISRVLGLVRDVLMAGLFGTTLPMSAFVLSFTIPNLFRRLFGEGALASAFVPVFVESKAKDGDESAWLLARKIISLAVLVLALLTVIGFVLVSVIMAFPLGEKADMVMPLLRIMLPYMFFICLVALSMGILNSFHHFLVPAATPCVMNLLWIGTAVLICPMVGPGPEEKIKAVAWAVLFAGVIQLLIQYPILKKYGYRPGWCLDLKDPRVVKVLKLMGPAALGLAVTQFNVMIDRLLAIWVGDYAPSALFYSERLIYLPLGLFATALGTVLLPVFSGHAAKEDLASFKETLTHTLRNLFYVMIPASIGLWVLARPIIQMIFEYGEFTTQSTDFTTSALQFYAPGLLVFSLAKIFVPAFYARQDTRTPVIVGCCTVGLNLVLNVLFILTWPQHLKHAGLAAATVIAEGVYAVVLVIILRRKLGVLGLRSTLNSVVRCLLAGAAMGVAAVYLNPMFLSGITNLGLASKPAQIISVLATIICSMIIYLIATMVLRSPEQKEIIKAALRK